MADIDISPGLKKMRQGLFADAKTYFANILKADPVHPEALHQLGLACFQLGDADDARAYLDRALFLKNDNPKLLNNRAVLAMHDSRFHLAPQLLGKAVGVDERNPDAWANLAAAFLHLHEDRNDVETALAKALELQPDHHDALLRLAELRLAQQRLPERIAILRRAAAAAGATPGALRSD